MTNMEIKRERERMEAMMYTNVHDLCRDCLVELKHHYMGELVNEGCFAEVMGRDYNEPSMLDLAEADSIIPDDVIFEVYDGIAFVPDDFFCLVETEE